MLQTVPLNLASSGCNSPSRASEPCQILEKNLKDSEVFIYQNSRRSKDWFTRKWFISSFRWFHLYSHSKGEKQAVRSGFLGPDFPLNEHRTETSTD